MIQYNTSILDDFSKHFNSRITLSDLIDSIHYFQEIVNGKIPPRAKFLIQLPCKLEIRNQLMDFGYIKLLKTIIEKVRIEEQARQVFESKIEFNTLNMLEKQFKKELEWIDIQPNEILPGFDIICGTLTQDILCSPLSQFHGEITIQLEYFNALIDAKSISSSRSDAVKSMYINSKVPTPFSYFVLAYIAENLGIPLKL